MTRPRCLDRGQTYLITRRCSERRFFLRPDPALNRLMTYLLAYAARKFDIAVHAFVFMSNHYHLVLTDSSSGVKLPEFMGWLNQHAAKTANLLRGRHGSVWEGGSYNAVALIGEAAILDEIAYTICNPVDAGLVSTPEKWPGLISRPGQLAQGRISAEKPGLFFKKPMPAEAWLELTPPPCFEDLSGEDYRRRVQRRIEGKLEEIRQRRKERREPRFLGAKAVLKQHWSEEPKTKAPVGEIKPLLACKDKALRRAVLEGLQQFVSDHQAAREDWCVGDRDVTFPAGTYGMVRFHGASVLEGPGVFSLK